MRNHHTEQLQGGNGKINSEKVSGQSSSIHLVSPYIISPWIIHMYFCDQAALTLASVLAVTRGQLVSYPNGAVAPFDPNNAAATKEHFAALAEVHTNDQHTHCLQPNTISTHYSTIYTLLKRCIHNSHSH